MDSEFEEIDIKIEEEDEISSGRAENIIRHQSSIEHAEFTSSQKQESEDSDEIIITIEDSEESDDGSHKTAIRNVKKSQEEETEDHRRGRMIAEEKERKKRMKIEQAEKQRKEQEKKLKEQKELEKKMHKETFLKDLDFEIYENRIFSDPSAVGSGNWGYSINNPDLDDMDAPGFDPIKRDGDIKVTEEEENAGNCESFDKESIPTDLEIEQAASFVDDAKSGRRDMHLIDPSSLKLYYIYHSPWIRWPIRIMLILQVFINPLFEYPQTFHVPLWLPVFIEIFAIFVYASTFLFFYIPFLVPGALFKTKSILFKHLLFVLCIVLVIIDSFLWFYTYYSFGWGTRWARIIRPYFVCFFFPPPFLLSSLPPFLPSSFPPFHFSFPPFPLSSLPPFLLLLFLYLFSLPFFFCPISLSFPDFI